MGYSNFKIKGVVLSMVFMLITACSHSTPAGEGENAAPAETADQVAPEVGTDAVPPSANSGPVVEDPNLASQAPMPAPDQAPGSAPAPEVAQEQPVAPTDSSAASPVTPSEPVVETPVAAAQENPVAPTSSGEATEYRVKKGDTMMKIAFEQYGDLYRWREIYEANRGVIKDPSHVPPGTKLVLNGAGAGAAEGRGERYKIKTGDTLGLISQDLYGTTKKWKRLWENNRQLIKNPNRIYAGFYLFYQPEAGRMTHEKKESSPAVEGTDAAAAVVAQPDQRTPASK